MSFPLNTLSAIPLRDSDVYSWHVQKCDWKSLFIYRHLQGSGLFLGLEHHFRETSCILYELTLQKYTADIPGMNGKVTALNSDKTAWEELAHL